MEMKMKHVIVALALAMTGATGCSDEPTATGNDQGGVAALGGGVDLLNGQYIVVMKDAAPGSVEGILLDLVRPFAGTVVRVYENAITGGVVTMSAADAAVLALDPRVRYVEPDYRVYLLPVFQPSPPASSQTTPYGITRVGGAVDGTGKTAWIIDTGIDFDHPDLNVDTRRSRNLVFDGHTSADDGNGHGTHVAGTIGARDNAIDVVGIAPNASLVAVRVLDNNGSGSYSSVIAGLDYVAATAQAGDAVNLSLGGPASNALDDAVRGVADRGIRVSLAAGNSSAHARDYSPARVDHPNVYTVSAIDESNAFASFSNYGNPPVDFAAPGVRVLSTKMGGGTAILSGTSMAAPHVAGLLLFGAPRADGVAQGDPDGTPDPVAHR
jgi:subtilisin family serine protease